MSIAPLPKELADRAHAAAASVTDRTIAEKLAEHHSLQYEIRFLGDPALTIPAQCIQGNDPETVQGVRALAIGMRRVCAQRRGGVALAAHQVGARAAVILTPVKGVRTIMVNPRYVVGRTGILRRSRKKELGLEGCLSIPDFWMHVERYTWVEIEFKPEDLGEWVRVKLEGFEARAFQHEFDHLAGRCIVDGGTRQQRRHAERCAEKAIAQKQRSA